MNAISGIILVMRPYPKELRSRVVAAVEQGELTIVDIASVFSVGLTFVKKRLRLHRAGEDLAPRHGGGPTPLLQDPERARLRAAVAQQPDVTLAELPHVRAPPGSRPVSLPTIGRALHHLQLPRKKKVASRRSGTKSPATNFARW
jgi:transposase